MTVKSVTPEEGTTRRDTLRNPLPAIPDIPSTAISDKSEVRETMIHILTTLADWNEMSDEAERTDPILWKSICRAFHEAEYALWAQVDAQCAHVVAHTLLVDRQRRQERRAKRGHIKDSETFTNLLSDYADAVAYFRAAQKQGDTAEYTTPEERRTSQVVRQAEQAIDAFLEAFYAEEIGLKK